jgi:hypothetical protein
LTSALCEIPGFSRRRRGRRKTLAVMFGAAVVLLALAAVVWKQRPAFDVTGIWLVEMQKPNQRSYQVRLEFITSGGGLTGTVVYPTGSGPIQSSTLERGRLTFVTTHTPQFSEEPVTIRWSGIVEGDGIRFTATDDSGVAVGIGRRSR